MAKRGTPEGNYVIEIDGIPPFRATSVTGGAESETAVAIPDGQFEREHKVAGNITVEDLTIEIAAGPYEEAVAALKEWRRGWKTRTNMVRRNVRRIRYTEDSRTELDKFEYLDCFPLQFSPVDSTARGDGFARSSLVLSCDDVEM